MTEQWRPVVGYEGFYEVSDEGRVRSLYVPGSVAGRTGPTPRIRRTRIWRGYDKVALSRDGQERTHGMQRLVLEAFVGPRPPGHQAAHLDGHRRNNRVSNLRWVTPAENEAHKGIHGTGWRGESRLGAKLTSEHVRTIRVRYAAGWVSQHALAREYGVHQRTISKIVRREKWGHVEPVAAEAAHVAEAGA